MEAFALPTIQIPGPRPPVEIVAYFLDKDYTPECVSMTLIAAQRIGKVEFIFSSEPS